MEEKFSDVTTAIEKELRDKLLKKLSYTPLKNYEYERVNNNEILVYEILYSDVTTAIEE